MSLTQAQIKHLSKLTALSSGTGNISMDSILDSFASLQSIDTSWVKIVSRSGNPHLLLRQDLAKEWDRDFADSLLHTSSQKVVAHQIALFSIMPTDA
jgi:Asp-tRNA(Asn)/Glu-tRNA(Gln) amidotransferase C subunit